MSAHCSLLCKDFTMQTLHCKDELYNALHLRLLTLKVLFALPLPEISYPSHLILLEAFVATFVSDGIFLLTMQALWQNVSISNTS